MEILLDANYLFGQRCIHGRGVVTRVDAHPSGAQEIAVDFGSVTFRPVSQPGLYDVASDRIS